MFGPRLGLVLVLATSGCAEIEFGVPAGGEQPSGGGPLAGNSAGGGEPGTEQCLNGVDDDNDGLADCADDDCAELACVELPIGWLGPVELRADDSPCEGPFSAGIASLKKDVEAAPATCTCGCVGIPQTCDTADLTFFGTVICGNAQMQVQLTNGTCESVENVQGADAFTIEPNVVSGSCTSSVETSIEPPTFEARRLCGLPAEGAGCDSGSCAPSATCVYMPGNVVCPKGFASSFMGNAGIIDSRGCDEGGCGCTASGGPCSYTVELYDNQNCQNGVVATTSSTGCQPVQFGGGGGNRGALFTATPGTVGCVSTGSGTPTGSVSLNEPITVCCAL